MNTPTKAMTLAVAVAAAGALIWFAGRFDGPTSHDYWIALGLIAAAGVDRRHRAARPRNAVG